MVERGRLCRVAVAVNEGESVIALARHPVHHDVRQREAQPPQLLLCAYHTLSLYVLALTS
jgi:hypothetical protein